MYRQLFLVKLFKAKSHIYIDENQTKCSSFVQRYYSRAGKLPGGDSHMKLTGMLVGKLELNP